MRGRVYKVKNFRTTQIVLVIENFISIHHCIVNKKNLSFKKALPKK